MQTGLCLPTPCGRGSSTCCPARRPIPAPPRRTTGGFSKPFSGGPGRDLPDATFRSASAIVTASSSASAAGRFLASSSVFSTRCRTSSTSSTCSLTARSSRRTRRRRAQKGDPQPRDRPFPGRPDQQDRGRRGRAWVSCAVHDPSRPGARPRGRAGSSGRSSVRGPDRRQGLQKVYYTVVEDDRFVTLGDWRRKFA